MYHTYINYIGAQALHLCAALGTFSLFFIRATQTILTHGLKWRKICAQMNVIGVNSFTIIMLTGSCTGMVVALQSYIGFQRVGGEQFIGAVVALGMVRELAPVLTGLMVTGRAGSAMAAEIGTMRITEQIDALRTLRIDIFQYLVVPRVIASIIVVPCLTAFAMLFGIAGGYCVCVYLLGLSPEDYQQSIKIYVELKDIMCGLMKSTFFGLIIAWVGTYKGYYTSGGARGVGSATTHCVVLSSSLILVSNYFLTKLLDYM